MGRFKIVSHDLHSGNAADRFSIPYIRYVLQASFMPEGATENEKFMYGRDVFNDLKEIDVKLANFIYGRTISCDIKKVIFNPPATIILWEDGTKTVVKTRDDDEYDREKGLAMAIAKKALGNKGNYYNVFTKAFKEADKEEEELNAEFENILSKNLGEAYDDVYRLSIDFDDDEVKPRLRKFAGLFKKKEEKRDD